MPDRVLPALLIIAVVRESGDKEKKEAGGDKSRAIRMGGREGGQQRHSLVHDKFVNAAECQPLLGRITDGHRD